MNIEHTKGLRDIPVKIKRLHPNAIIPKYATELAAGFDLVATEDVIIAPGETKLIPLGFAVQIPEGFEMQIRPRSGVTLKTKLRVGNSPGTIDADFRGEVKVIVDNIAQLDYEVDEIIDYDYEEGSYSNGYEMSVIRHNALHTTDNTGYTPQGNVLTEDSVPVGTYIIRKGDRIAQGVIAPVYRAEFIEVDSLDETERGAGGIGHTGVNTKEVNE